MLPTEPIGSIPRPAELVESLTAFTAGRVSAESLESILDHAVRDTLRRFEATGSPVITDGEQRKPSFATYPVHGSELLTGGGVTIPFKDGHTRQLPVLTGGPFRYVTYAATYLEGARKHTRHSAEAGRDIGICAVTAVSRERHRRLPAGGLP